MRQPEQKDMSWGKFCLFLIWFYLLLYGFFYLMHKIYQPALAHDQKIEAAKKLPATK